MAWFKLDGQGIDDPERQFAVTWRSRDSFISPVWQLDVPDWPRDPAANVLATPVLRAWWLGSGRRLPPAASFKMDAGGFPRTVRIDDSNSVVVESLAVEPHLVEVEPGQRAREILPRGPARVPQRAARTSWSRASSPGSRAIIAGHEHRFYTAAAKYTGLFWPVNQPQFEKLKEVGVTSLAQLLGQAEKQKTTVSLKLPIPQAGRLPQPPAAIRN